MLARGVRRSQALLDGRSNCDQQTSANRSMTSSSRKYKTATMSEGEIQRTRTFSQSTRGLGLKHRPAALDVDSGDLHEDGTLVDNDTFV